MWWQTDRFDAGSGEDFAKTVAKLGVAIHEEIALANQKAFLGGGQVSSNLLHPNVVRTGCNTGEVNAACCQFHHEEQIERDRASSAPWNQGSFPPPALPGFSGTMNPSDPRPQPDDQIACWPGRYP